MARKWDQRMLEQNYNWNGRTLWAAPCVNWSFFCVFFYFFQSEKSQCVRSHPATVYMIPYQIKFFFLCGWHGEWSREWQNEIAMLMKIYSEMQSRAKRCGQRRESVALHVVGVWFVIFRSWSAIWNYSEYTRTHRLVSSGALMLQKSRLQYCFFSACLFFPLLFCGVMRVPCHVMRCIQKISHYCICLTAKIRTKDENGKRTNECAREREMKEQKRIVNNNGTCGITESILYSQRYIMNALHKINDAIVCWNEQSNIEVNALAALKHHQHQSRGEKMLITTCLFSLVF